PQRKQTPKLASTASACCTSPLTALSKCSNREHVLQPQEEGGQPTGRWPVNERRAWMRGFHEMELVLGPSPNPKKRRRDDPRQHRGGPRPERPTMMDDFQPGDLAYNQGYTEVFLVMDVAFDEHGQMWLWLADRNCDILAL